MTQWKTIDRFPSYEVSSDGLVRRRLGGRGAVIGKVINWHTHTSTGYPDIRFSVNRRQTAMPVHRIVAAAFLGSRPEGMQIRHLDGNKMNNCVSNLCYGTAKENNQDKVKHGTSSKGIWNPMSKLTHDQVLKIRGMNGQTKAKHAAQIFGLHESTVYRIWNKKYWSHL